ncbi:MAG TPA: HAMP domain-containing sensor histidine kinase, partial [Candidatus Wallbacteria bacterium]|nr:HAMP domain-containing sensor histidine kinase [Candidatus Wallbacteria bacterium]
LVHEIKNPLTVIKLAKDSIRYCNAGANQEMECNLKQIEDSTERIHKTILNTLNFAKVVPSGQEKLDLKAVVANSIELCRHKTKLKNIQLTFECASQRAEIVGNASQIEQVMINLISNAIHSIPEGRDGLIKVELGVTDSLICCTIQDNGCGMSEELIANIFEPFFTTKSQSGGSGLGLSICQAIISQHNGSINCRSKLGEGSAFTVNFGRAG